MGSLTKQTSQSPLSTIRFLFPYVDASLPVNTKLQLQQLFSKPHHDTSLTERAMEKAIGVIESAIFEADRFIMAEILVDAPSPMSSSDAVIVGPSSSTTDSANVKIGIPHNTHVLSSSGSSYVRHHPVSPFNEYSPYRAHGGALERSFLTQLLISPTLVNKSGSAYVPSFRHQHYDHCLPNDSNNKLKDSSLSTAALEESIAHQRHLSSQLFPSDTSADGHLNIPRFNLSPSQFTVPIYAMSDVCALAESVARGIGKTTSSFTSSSNESDLKKLFEREVATFQRHYFPSKNEFAVDQATKAKNYLMSSVFEQLVKEHLRKAAGSGLYSATDFENNFSFPFFQIFVAGYISTLSSLINIRSVFDSLINSSENDENIPPPQQQNSVSTPSMSQLRLSEETSQVLEDDEGVAYKRPRLEKVLNASQHKDMLKYGNKIAPIAALKLVSDPKILFSSTLCDLSSLEKDLNTQREFIEGRHAFIQTLLVKQVEIYRDISLSAPDPPSPLFIEKELQLKVTARLFRELAFANSQVKFAIELLRCVSSIDELLNLLSLCKGKCVEVAKTQAIKLLELASLDI